MWPAGYRHRRRNRSHHAGRAAGSIASCAHFPEPTAFIDGIHHVADTGRNACHFSRCSHIHTGGRSVFRLICSPDRPEPSAGRALRAHLLAPVLIAIQPKRKTSGILVTSLKERLGGRFSLEGKRLCQARGASLCQDRLPVIIDSESGERLPQMRLEPPGEASLAFPHSAPISKSFPVYSH